MVKIRGSTFFSGMSGASAMNQVGASAIQVYGPGRMTWASKAVIVRNAPYTIERPSQGQIAQRIKFGRAGAQARGTKGLDPNTGLPHGAVATMSGARGPTGLAVGPNPKRSFHTISQLERMASTGPQTYAPRGMVR